MAHHEDTTTALAICLLADQPLVLWGPPGQGKSSAVQQVARDLGLHLETVIASVREPSDFAGLPVVDPGTGSVRFAPPAWAQRLHDRGDAGGIAFYDEISTAPPAVQAAMLRVVQEGWVGDLQLPASVRTIAAANPPDMAADGWDLAAPMANRFTHLDWTLSADTIRDGFSVGWPTVPAPSADPDTLRRLTAEAMVLVGSFIGNRPELRTVLPGTAAEAGRAFPTPRSWEAAARLYATARACGVNDTVVTLLVSGTVGAGAANEFLHFVSTLDLPDPEELLRDPDGLVLDRTRNDRAYTIAASVWAATARDTTPERWTACGLVLARIAQAHMGDIAFLFGRRWVLARPAGVMPPREVTEHLAPILTEMGVLR
ncbi:AAA domain-containing protein [Modestobacter sp. I12A-02628]|uniref:AAA domain-containing protein n=1 Tax=Goekera deserti TaxID=2497753 RepID=A0A7K3WKA4_9ACTN|nr:MoxR family ATPase [Goekera deserti]MPQ99098.1 AAA domain-containing protein [Goekera deserti]NDI47432.1 AAA domain-containing protein [Goekera deserti]NEL55963.1 AAA domain-containing protein [Goekera deserti]